MNQFFFSKKDALINDERKKRNNQRLLKALIYHGYLEMVKLLLEEGITHRITRNGGDGKSPLEGAQEKGKQNVANYLIAKMFIVFGRILHFAEEWTSVNSTNFKSWRPSSDGSMELMVIKWI